MSISYFTIGLKIWHPTDMRVHLFCYHLVYVFVFLTKLAQQKPWRFTGVSSTLWECIHDVVLWLTLHSKFGTSTLEISLPLTWSASTSKLVPSPPGNSTSLSQLSRWEQAVEQTSSSHHTDMGFSSLCDFIKVWHRLEAKCPGSPPCQTMKWVPYSSEILIKENCTNISLFAQGWSGNKDLKLLSSPDFSFAYLSGH